MTRRTVSETEKQAIRDGIADGLSNAAIARSLGHSDTRRVENAIHNYRLREGLPHADDTGGARAAKFRAPALAGTRKTGELRVLERVTGDVESMGDLLRACYADLERLGRQRQTPAVKSKASGIMAEVSIMDLHLGKYAWGEETGADYDMRIAESIFCTYFDRLVQNIQKSEHVERWLFPIGNDLMHVDSDLNATTAGTPQDVDTRYHRSFRRAVGLMSWAIAELRKSAPVDVLIVPGNHDRWTSFHLGEVLGAYFKHQPGVTIDNRPKLRKYHQWGDVGIGFTHGSEEKEKDLPLIMANEEPAMWAATKHHEWHIGHWHKIRETRWSAADSFGGVRVRVLPSLCAADAWHARMGYIGELRAAEAYLWDKTDGYLGELYTLLPRKKLLVCVEKSEDKT